MKSPANTQGPVASSGTIVTTPGICGGKPRIAGHRIRVLDVVIWHERLKMSVEEILAEYPSLAEVEIAAAFHYYEEHREEIRATLQEEDDFADSMERPTHPLLVRSPRGFHAQDDPLPPG